MRSSRSTGRRGDAVGKVSVGINLEYVRSSDKSFEWAMDKAADMGFEYVEPMVHWGRELLSAAGYYHTVSMLDDPFRVSDAAERNGLKISGLSSHAPLCRPDVSTDYLKQAVRFAAECGAPIVITDSGPPRAAWATDDENHVLMRYVLEETLALAERRGIIVALETHAEYTDSPAALQRTYELVSSDAIAINFDTGNSFLSGNDPHVWLEDIIDTVACVHAKDISGKDAAEFRGKVKGMLGCACGDGVIDWPRIVETCQRAPRDIVLSIECASIPDAERSLAYFRSIGL
jgi:sugar phosphate isomerase/epimerase